MITRAEIEAREQRELAPFAMCAVNSQGRQHPEPEHPLRTAFQRDRDRIIHCTAFRRLEYKTQVFANDEGDLFRTRLTHTLEVAQIARTISRALGLNDDLCEAIALAHDLGHTAFGHTGERVMQGLMADHGGFEHNRQGLRVVDLLEDPYPAFRGLNLTREVREAILKYPDPDLPAEAELCQGRQPLLEAQVVDRADSIAYVHHDLDDALRAGILEQRHLERDLELWADAAREARQRLGNGDDPRARRKMIIRELINLTATDLIQETSARLATAGIDSAATARAHQHPLVAPGERLARCTQTLLEYLLQHFYQHHQILRLAGRAERIFTELFSAYVSTPAMLPPRWARWAETQGVERAVCDYLAGMTDRWASQDYARLFLPVTRP
jgi:dGTPase